MSEEFKVGDRVWLDVKGNRAARATILKLPDQHSGYVFKLREPELIDDIIIPMKIIGKLPPKWWQFWRNQ